MYAPEAAALGALLLLIAPSDDDEGDAGGRGHMSTANIGVGLPELSLCQRISGVRAENCAAAAPAFVEDDMLLLISLNNIHLRIYASRY